MVRQLAASLTAVLLFISGPAVAFAQITPCMLLGTSSGQNPAPMLVVLDPATGAVARIIGVLSVGIGGLAVHPITGVLFGVTAPGGAGLRNLVRIDPITAATTVVGPIGLGLFGIADLAFRGDGTLFAWSENSDDLITINTTTGAGTIVGSAGISTFGSGLEFSPSGTLYLAGNGASGPLRTVNPSNGLTTAGPTLTGAPFPGEPINALTFHPDGRLFGVNLHFVTGGVNPTNLVTINPTSGVVTNVGPSLTRLDAIVFYCGLPVPTLSQWGMLLLTGLLIGLGCWRLAQHRRVTLG